METKRKEFIDFLLELTLNEDKYLVFNKASDVVDCYLKSINSDKQSNEVKVCMATKAQKIYCCGTCELCNYYN